MPWTANETERHTHKATTCSLKSYGRKSPTKAGNAPAMNARAIREANAVVARQVKKKLTLLWQILFMPLCAANPIAAVWASLRW